jgi:hypothetical protein
MPLGRQGSGGLQRLRSARSSAYGVRPPERNMGPHLIITGAIADKDSSKVLRVERDQMIRTLAPDRSDQAFSMSVRQGERYKVGWSRIPMAPDGGRPYEHAT